MDPYTAQLQILRPRDRNRDPRDPREPYTRKYITLPIAEPFPSTGSFNFRQGLFIERPMTVQEQNFEQFVNVRQAEHDISSSINEWQRLKALEEDAIQLWQDLDGNLAEYQRQMRTRDQQAMEHQCQRKKERNYHLHCQAEFSRAYEQKCLDAATRRAFKEAVQYRVITEAQKPGAMDLAAQEAFMEKVRRSHAEFMKAAAATKAQKRPSEVASATDGVASNLGMYLESGEESSHSRSPQQSGSADSIPHDLGSPSLPTKQPIHNTVPSPRTSPRQPPTLTQPSQDSSNSTSPPRSTSVNNSTPPSSKRPTPPESLRSSPPKTPKASSFFPDLKIWGPSILASSSNRPSQSPSLISSPQPQSLNPSPTIAPRVPLTYSYLKSITKVNSMRYQGPQPVHTTNASEPALGEQRRRVIPTEWTIRAREELKKKRAQGDTFVTIIKGEPPSWRAARGA